LRLRGTFRPRADIFRQILYLLVGVIVGKGGVPQGDESVRKLRRISMCRRGMVELFFILGFRRRRGLLRAGWQHCKQNNCEQNGAKKQICRAHGRTSRIQCNGFTARGAGEVDCADGESCEKGPISGALNERGEQARNLDGNATCRACGRIENMGEKDGHIYMRPLYRCLTPCTYTASDEMTIQQRPG